MISNDILNIALIEYDIKWEDPTSNINYLEKKLNNLPNQIEFIILPEMFTTGFTMNAANYAESMNGKTIKWMKSVAFEKKCAIAGSIIIKENNCFYNRFVFVYPDKRIEYYDKRHLFSLASEEKVYEKGVSKKIVEFKNWKINLQICYDLRFPVWSRNSNNYDLLLYVANWPDKRIKHWDILLQARAIENMSYCVGVNRIGKDINDHQYPGHSNVIDFKGKPLAQLNEDNNVKLFNLVKTDLYKYRANFKFLEDRDSFNLEV